MQFLESKCWIDPDHIMEGRGINLETVLDFSREAN